MAIVTVRNLKKAYGDFYAVDGISFEIEAGEIFGFLGPNGAGKTSTINMLIGMSRPTEGEIIIDGIRLKEDIKRAQRIIGVVPDESNLYDELNGFENLCFCASLYGIGKGEREERARKLLKLFKLEDAADRPFRAYSKGMKRRLTIAAAIIHNPKILFLDEPTTGIDVESARQIRDLLLALRREGKTIFLTTHYLEEAERICDRIAFIVGGKIVKISTMDELMKNSVQGYTVKLSFEAAKKRLEEVKNHLERKFNIDIDIEDEDSCLIRSKEAIPLYPILKDLNDEGIAVFEARTIKPSLEEIFLRITEIEASAGKVGMDR